MPSGPLDTRCGDYGGPLPLRNLSSLAQAFKGGNTRVSGSMTGAAAHRRRATQPTF
jgi:hypothetical protein